MLCFLKDSCEYSTNSVLLQLGDFFPQRQAHISTMQYSRFYPVALPMEMLPWFSFSLSHSLFGGLVSLGPISHFSQTTFILFYSAEYEPPEAKHRVFVG